MIANPACVWFSAQVSYNSAISACAKSGKWQQAVALLEVMPVARIAPNTITYNSAISACSKGGASDRALDLLSKMRCEPGAQPDVISYNAAISSCRQRGEWARAQSLLDEMRVAGVVPTTRTYSACISTCTEGRQWRRALALLAEMRAAGVEPDLSSLTAAMQVLTAASELDAAFELIVAFPLSLTSYKLHHVLLTACRRVGDSRAGSLQSSIHRRGLMGLPAVVRFDCAADGAGGEEEQHHVNGCSTLIGVDAYGANALALDAAVEELYERVAAQSAYTPRFEALPLDFVQRASEAEQVHSLKYHAEKRALASMLLRGASKLTMRVNIKVCVDCHSFLLHAASVLGKPISIDDPKQTHLFAPGGGCSCDGLEPFSRAAAAPTAPHPCAGVALPPLHAAAVTQRPEDTTLERAETLLGEPEDPSKPPLLLAPFRKPQLAISDTVTSDNAEPVPAAPSVRTEGAPNSNKKRARQRQGRAREQQRVADELETKAANVMTKAARAGHDAWLRFESDATATRMVLRRVAAFTLVACVAMVVTAAAVNARRRRR